MPGPSAAMSQVAALAVGRRASERQMGGGRTSVVKRATAARDRTVVSMCPESLGAAARRGVGGPLPRAEAPQPFRRRVVRYCLERRDPMIEDVRDAADAFERCDSDRSTEAPLARSAEAPA